MSQPVEPFADTIFSDGHSEGNVGLTALGVPLRLTPLPSQSDELQLDAQSEAAHFVAVSRFTVAQKIQEVKQAFRQRPHLVDDATGFVSMDVISPHDAPNEIWLITHWVDEASYRAWHHSHLYHDSHQGIPKGLKLVPKSVSIQCFEHIAS